MHPWFHNDAFVAMCPDRVLYGGDDVGVRDGEGLYIRSGQEPKPQLPVVGRAIWKDHADSLRFSPEPRLAYLFDVPGPPAALS
jgi:hypothetical protein